MLLWRNCNLLKELEKIFCVLAFVLLLCVGNLSAQYAKIVDSKKYSKSEMSLFSASIAYFESADYANAYMGFSQLHSWYASDPVFCYYCGASMVMLRNEYDKAIKYLSLAYDNNLYEADYYIGLAYHRKYLFSKSITYYSRYRDYLVKATKGRSPKIAEVEMLMEKANKARALGQESFALKVLTNSKVKRSNFHFSYGRKILDGNLVVKPDFFRQRNDKNNRDIDLVYVLDTIAFVSSYGNDMKTGLDLYVSRKTDEGWSSLQLLPGMVNTDYDEAFPFLSSDGVLYFASKGHNSIGGYDIFKSEYDAGLGLWGKPENLGFPINTPYDDFMYAIESNGKSAFFASDRSSKDGQVMVCRYVLEPDVEKIMIKTEEDLAEHAELPVTPGAEAEYERISREQPAEPEAKDSTPDKVEPQRELDTTDLFVSTRTMLDEKISAISNYDEYSQKLDAYARITSNKIRKAKISGSNSGMSSSEIAQMANSVVIFYDLSRKFNSVYATAKPTLERCANDMESLGKMEPGSGEYQFRLHNINVSVGKVNAKSPLAVMIAEKKNERKQADDALKKLSRNMVKDRKNLREINEKLESVMQLIQKETDPKLRERYVNEHKTLENSKVDVINEMKNMQVEAKRLNLMIQKTDESIKMLEDIDEIIANIDLNALEDEAEVGSGDILEMKDLVSEEEDKVVTEFEKTVDEDESLYSEVIDYESISSDTENDARLVTDEVLALEGYMSSSTSAVVQKMKATDALYSEKSNLESQFDATETEPEKTELLNQINATQKQITENVKAIEAELSYRENPSVSKAIEDFNAIKQTKVEGEAWSDLVSTTQNLIEKSNELAEQMSGQKQPSAVSDVKAKLVGRIKADIDNQIVDNVAEMQDFAVSQQNKREVADMSREVTKIRSSVKDKSFEADIMKDISSVTKKVEASKRETSATGSNLAEAENILDGTVVKRIAILNEEYDVESRVYDVLNEKYSATKSSDRLRQQADVIYYSALEDKQQADAETDDVVRMKYLSEANKKMKSANSALMQAISPDAKLETQSNDEITESILTLYNDIKAQKGVLSSPAEPLDPSRPLSVAEASASSLAQNDPMSNSQSVKVSNNPSSNPPIEPVDPSRPLSVAEGSGNETSIQNAQHNGVAEGSGSTISSQSLQHSVTLQADLTKRISTNNDDITTIATNMATANRSEKKRLETYLGEVISERNDNVRTLGEEKQRFYAELDKAKHDDIAKTSASADYTNRYADYRQSLYSLTNADPSTADMTEKLAEAEKSEYALLQTIIPNVDAETSIVLVQIYSELDAKYGNTSPAEPVEASASSSAQNDPMSNSQSVIVSNNPSSNPPAEPADPSRPLSVAEGSGNETSIQNTQHNGVVEGSGRPISSRSLQHSVTLQTDLTKRISTNNDDITTIATNMATADRGEKKRLETFLGEVTAERNGNVRSLGEEKQRFYAELDKSKHDDIAKTSASTDYTNRYADYRQSLYSLTNADPSTADMTEKLAEAEKSEYALLQTIIPNVDAETSIVLVQIYSELDAKYGNTSPAEPVEASASSSAQNDPMSNSQSVIVSNNPSSNPPAEPADPSRPLSVAEGSGNETSIQNAQQNGVVEGSGSTISSQSLQHSVTLQTDLTKRISTNNDDITTIATNMATADRGEKKRLQTFLGEVTAERNDNVRTLGEEKQRFYAELDKSKHDDIAKTGASADYTNRYADYRQSLYSLTNADPSTADMTEKLAEAEKSEYALLQTIIPNVDAETSIVLVQIYSELDAKYGNTSPAKPVEASVSSTAQNDPMSNGQSVIVSNNPSYNPPSEPLDPSRPLSVVEGKGNDISAQNSQQNGVAKELDDNSAITTSVDSQQLKASVVRQSEISNRITINASEISAIEGVIAVSAGSDKQRLQNELGEITAQRNSNVRSLSEEKQHFYAEIDKSVHDAIAKSDVSSEYTNRYTTYRQSLYNLANAEQSSADMSQKLAEAEKAEYALLQTIIPNADSETKSILLPVYNGLEAKYGTTGGVEIAGVVPETYSRSMTLQEQMVRNIEISTKEIERLEQRKEVAKKSEQRRIADDIAREESQKLDDIQKLAVEKSKFYSELNSSLETILPTLSDSARQEYKLAYDSYDETLRTMKIGLGFYDMSVANKIYSDSEIQEYKLLQQMSQVATGETKTVVDNMIGRMEANNSTLRRYKVVVDYVIVGNTVSNASTNSNVAEKRDSVSLNIPDSNSTILASVDSTVVAPKKKSMSGFSADSYGIFEEPEINMGLYYRIQIVAANVKYRMPYFNGLSLIFTEQIPNTNIIRYMTGEYYRYVSAREDLPKVRGLGFSDAFIVAYYNGKRISIGEARRLEALQNAEENEEIPIVIRHEAPADYVEPESIIASSQTKTETIANVGNGASVANNSISSQSVTEENSAVYSENVAINGQIVSSGNVVDSQAEIAVDSHEIPSKGVYYAVQIGVYKDRRQPSQMKGVSPIDYETMPNGYIRHTSGRFGNYDQARASQTNIRRQGISDAFVIAYIDGRKVSFSEAIEYQKSLESRVIAEVNAENTTSKTQGVVSSEENLSNVEYAPLNLNTGTEENNKEGISYYVQIGAFSKSPDPEILSVFSKVAGDKIHVKFPREGLQVYRIGVFSSYEEAQNTLAEARSFGIVDAFIVAFKGEEQISSSEAIRLQNAVRQIEGNSGETINNNVGQKSSQTIQPTSNAEPKPVVPAETLQQASGGVEYFVQLGAFVHTPDTRSMATFRAIATTSGSRLSTVQNGKFTNYRVGAFKKFDDVKAAVENARSMGVTDAFVVAFYNGERIPVVEAKEKE